MLLPKRRCFNLSYGKTILYHLHIIDEKLDECEELSEYPC